LKPHRKRLLPGGQVSKEQKNLVFEPVGAPLDREAVRGHDSVEGTTKGRKSESEVFKKLLHEAMDRKLPGDFRHGLILDLDPCQFKENSLA